MTLLAKTPTESASLVVEVNGGKLEVGNIAPNVKAFATAVNVPMILVNLSVTGLQGNADSYLLPQSPNDARISGIHRRDGIIPRLEVFIAEVPYSP